MTNESLKMHNGVPVENDYELLSKSNDFARMRSFSNSFLRRNEEALRSYAKQWVADPLHQWSRQWEYPFVNDRIEQLRSRESLRILDAGSGATFFPYYLTKQQQRIHVDCCDYDKSLKTIHDQLIRNEEANVNFSFADLRDLPFEGESVDVVYCISVLEHTNAYEAIVNEFFRVLRPGGKLVVTFDISRDGKDDIPADTAEELLALLIDKSDADASRYPAIEAELRKPSIVTTRLFLDSAPQLLPWTEPGPIDHLKSFLKSGRPKTLPDLTFYCLDLDKPSD